MFEEIKEVILEQLDVDEENVQLNSNIVQDFGADSLDLIELAESISIKYKIEFEKDEFKNIKTVQDLVDLVSEKRRNLK